jgi:hypothetical protein
MADEFDEAEFLSSAGIDPEQDSPTMKLLRRQLKELGKERKALADKLAAIETEKAKAALEDTWKTLGVPEPVRGFYKGEDNADAIKSWWESSKQFFNVPADGEPPAQAAEPQGQQELQQVAQATALGSDVPGSLTADALQQLAKEASKLSANNNPDKLDEFFAKIGLPKGGYTVPQKG